MAEGSSNQGIADALVITLRAVEKYVSSIFGKLGLPSTGTDPARARGALASAGVSARLSRNLTSQTHQKPAPSTHG